MTIMMFKNGQWVIDEANPIEQPLEGLILMLDGFKAGDTLTFDGTMWTNVSPAPVLYVNEAAGESDAVILDKTYADIKGAVEANKAVYIASVADGVTTLTPLATFGGNDTSGYSVTAGAAEYTATTATGTLTKED